MPTDFDRRNRTRYVDKMYRRELPERFASQLARITPSSRIKALGPKPKIRGRPTREEEKSRRLACARG